MREHSLAKVPVLLVVGKREAEERKVSIRRLGSQEQTVMGLDEALAMLKAEAVPPDLGWRSIRSNGEWGSPRSLMCCNLQKTESFCTLVHRIIGNTLILCTCLLRTAASKFRLQHAGNRR